MITRKLWAIGLWLAESDPGSALRLRPQPLQAPPHPLQTPPLPARPACLGFCGAEGTEGSRSCRFAQSQGAWDRDAVTGELLASSARASAQPAGPWQPPRSGAVAEQPLSPPPGSGPRRRGPGSAQVSAQKAKRPRAPSSRLARSPAMWGRFLAPEASGRDSPGGARSFPAGKKDGGRVGWRLPGLLGSPRPQACDPRGMTTRPFWAARLGFVVPRVLCVAAPRGMRRKGRCGVARSRCSRDAAEDSVARLRPSRGRQRRKQVAWLPGASWVPSEPSHL